MTEAKPKHSLTVLHEQYSICRLPPANALAQWMVEGEFASVSYTDDELSIVCETESLPNNLRAEHEEIDIDSGWRVMRVDGILDFAEVGVLAGMSKVLADADVSIFAISTYNTDHILVKNDVLKRAVEALANAGYGIAFMLPLVQDFANEP